MPELGSTLEGLLASSGAGSLGAVKGTQARLEAELAQLRSSVDALTAEREAQLSIQLSVLGGGTLLPLGQAAELWIAVTDGRGRPQAGVPVVLSTTWGRLDARNTFLSAEADRAASLQTRTDKDGVARVVLSPATPQPFTLEERVSLEGALSLLDLTASTPRQAQAQLQEITRLYRLPSSGALRSAVDTLVQAFGERALETLEQQDYLSAWSFSTATVFAHATAPERGDSTPVASTPVQAVGVLPLPVFDWLGAWLEVYRQVVDAEGTLDRELEKLGARPGKTALLSAANRRVQAFANLEAGAAGARIGARVAEQSIQRFLSEGFRNLPKESLQQLVPALTGAAQTLSTSGPALLGNLTETRAELVKKIDRGGVGKEQLGALTGRLDGLDLAVAGKADLDRLSSLETSVGQRLGQKADVDRLSSLEASVSQRFNQKADLEELSALQQSLETSVSQQLSQKADAGRLSALETSVSQQFGQKADAASVQQLTQALAAERARAAALEERLAGAASTIGTLNETVRRLDTRLGSFNQKLTDLSEQITRGNQRFDLVTQQMSEQVTRLDQLNANLDQRFATVTQRVTVLDQGVNRINQTVTTLNTDVTVLRRRITPP